MTEAAPTPDSPWLLGELSAKLKSYIDKLGQIWVEGEITAFTPRSSGIFGTLKDPTDEAAMGFAMWSSAMAKLPEGIGLGSRVVALVKVDFWKKGGDLKLNVLEMRLAGLGNLLEQLQQLKEKLHKEGLFDESRKLPLPFLPNRIGLITGANSDAEKDVLRNAKLRWPQVEFEIRNTKVQGNDTVPEVIAALKELDALPEVDVIIIARGGGDFLNLLPFSDEALLRAVAAAETPVVSAIGHEADQPLLDFVADLRASTPTDAAKRVVPDVTEELARVEQARGRIRLQVNTFVTTEFDKLQQLRSRPHMATTDWIITDRAQDIMRAIERGNDLVNRAFENAHAEVATLRGQLRALSPQQTLDRGYAIAVGADKKALRAAKDAPAGTKLVLTLADGKLAATSDGPEK